MRTRSKARPRVEAITPQAVATTFDPARLAQARHVAGKTRADVADAIGVSPASAGQYEAGIIRPRPYLIPRIATYLNVPIGFLAAGRPHVRLTVNDVHVADARTSMRDRLKAAAAVEQIWELVYALERRVHLPYVDLPGFAGGELTPTDAGPAPAARQLRTAWGVNGPMPHLGRTLECHGIVIAAPATDPDVAALGAHSASRLPRPVIVPTAAAATDVYRWRWELARQLGHLLMHGETPPGTPGHGRAADLFASELLLPAAEVAEELGGKMTARRIVDMCRTWGVPAGVLVNRRLQLGLIGSQRASSSRVAISDSRPITEFPGETPTIIAKAFDMTANTVLSIADELAWTTGRVSQLLGYEDRRPVLRLVV